MVHEGGASGALFVNGNQPFSDVVLDAAGGTPGTLGGSGTVRSVTANSGGAVSPGLSPGILHTGPAVTFAAGSTFAVQLNGPAAGTQYDQLAVAGTAALAGNLSVTLGYTPSVGTMFTILTATVSRTGTFEGLPDAGVLCADDIPLQVAYGPTAVTLTVVGTTEVPAVTPPAPATQTQTVCQ
jgi:fibronectin-binding autotransporter adhesin